MLQGWEKYENLETQVPELVSVISISTMLSRVIELLKLV